MAERAKCPGCGKRRVLHWHDAGWDLCMGCIAEIERPVPKPNDEDGSRCALCGVAVRYGARCPAHYGVYPEPSDS